MKEHSAAEQEKNRLSHIAQTFSQFDKDEKVNRFRARTITQHCKGPRILELGCGDGLVTAELVRHFAQVVAVDGSQDLLGKVRERAPQATLVHALFEEFQPDHPFDTIVLGHVLEHVLDPLAILRLVRGWMAEDGRMIITVPNGDSIHRRLGVELGMIRSGAELTDDDLRIGHRRVFVLDTLLAVIAAAGLQVRHVEGVMFKPLSNRQMFDWPDDLLEGFYRLAQRLPPEFGGELCAVCLPE